MVKIQINNKTIVVPEGMTVLKAAELAGIYIPTLCHKDDLPHYTSCYVCIVKDISSDKYIPSCSALVHEGMNIDTSGEDVTEMRKRAVELLLYEHRAECEAPCRIVCPAGLNIPLMNRLIASENLDGAKQLAMSESHSSEIMCVSCPAYCENACRRKKIDKPVSIRNIQLFISKSIGQDEGYINAHNVKINDLSRETPDSRRERVRKRFSSRIGRLEAEELSEWLKECEGSQTRSEKIDTFEDAVDESRSCMHCDCRASENCRLREIAEQTGVKDPRGKIVATPIKKKINRNTGLIFESAKCIKCGLCVRICDDNKDEAALCFINRGFVTLLSEPLTESFSDTLKTMADKCIEICPTGALSRYN